MVTNLTGSVDYYFCSLQSQFKILKKYIFHLNCLPGGGEFEKISQAPIVGHLTVLLAPIGGDLTIFFVKNQMPGVLLRGRMGTFGID